MFYMQVGCGCACIIHRVVSAGQKAGERGYEHEQIKGLLFLWGPIDRWPSKPLRLIYIEWRRGTCRAFLCRSWAQIVLFQQPSSLDAHQGPSASNASEISLLSELPCHYPSPPPPSHPTPRSGLCITQAGIVVYHSMYA